MATQDHLVPLRRYEPKYENAHLNVWGNVVLAHLYCTMALSDYPATLIAVADYRRMLQAAVQEFEFHGRTGIPETSRWEGHHRTKPKPGSESNRKGGPKEHTERKGSAQLCDFPDSGAEKRRPVRKTTIVRSTAKSQAGRLWNSLRYPRLIGTTLRAGYGRYFWPAGAAGLEAQSATARWALLLAASV